MPQTMNIKLYYISTDDYRQATRAILKVVPVTARSTLVSWSDLDYEVASNSVIYVQKNEISVSSDSPEGDTGWDTIATIQGTAAPEFLDEEANNTLYRHGLTYYRLVVPSAELVVGPMQCYGTPDVMATEIVRRHKIRLRGNYSFAADGNKMYAFVRHRMGVRCPVCWDEIFAKRTKVSCTVCNDTGFIRGYYDPRELYVSLSDEGSSGNIGQVGVANERDTISGWTANYPLLGSGDVLIEPGNHNVWTVMGVDLTTHKRVITKQTLHLQRAQGDDAILVLMRRLPGGK